MRKRVALASGLVIFGTFTHGSAQETEFFEFTEVIHGRDNPARLDRAEVMLTFLGSFVDDPADGVTPRDVEASRRLGGVDVGEAAAFLTILDRELANHQAEKRATKAEACARGFPTAESYASAADEADARIMAHGRATYDQILQQAPGSIRQAVLELEEKVINQAAVVRIDYREMLKRYDFKEVAERECSRL